MVLSGLFIFALGSYFSNNTIITSKKLIFEEKVSSPTSRGDLSDSLATNQFFTDWNGANPDNWTITGTGGSTVSKETGDTHSDPNAVLITWVAEMQSDQFYSAEQPVSTAATYTVGVYYKGIASHLELNLKIEFYSSSPSTWGSGSYSTGSGTFPASATWAYHEFSDETDSTNGYARVGIVITALPGTGTGETVLIDDVYWYTEVFLEFPSLSTGIIISTGLGLFSCLFIFKKRK